MPSVPSISFNVRYDLTSAPTLVLTDATTYPVGAIGIFTITQPDGYVRTGNFSSPDVSSSGGTLSTALRLSSTGGVQCGTYTIKYEIRTTDLVISTFTREFVFTYVPVSLNLKENFDVFTPSLSYSDITSYGVNNYSNIAPTRAWTSVSIPTGTKTANTSTISLQHNGSFYDAVYTISLASTLTYQHTTLAWLSVLETVSTTVVAEACTPEPLEDLIAMMETLRQNSINCAGDLPIFEKAQSLFSHLMDQVKMALLNNIPQDGIYDTYEDLMAILRNGQPCVHTNLPIPPYDLGDYAVSPFPIDLSYCDLIGDGYNTTYTVNHDLNDDCVIVQVYEASTGAQVLCDVTVSDNNNVDVSFYTAPTTDQYKVVVYAGARGQIGPGVAAGGTTGQYLRKTSATNYATYWDTLDAADIPVLDMSKVATGTLAWSRLTATPTTLAGYGITDPVILTSGSYSNPPWLTELAWSKITGAPSFITTETDPIFTVHPAFGVTGTKITNWDAAYSWVSAFPTQTGNVGKFLTTNGSALSWADVVSGVSSFNTRTGAVLLNSSDVTTALGYTPYNSTNPSAYISGITSGNVTTALGFTPVPTTRNLTINGVTQDLSADRTFTVSAANIYTADGTLTGDRVVTSNGNRLTILGGKEDIASNQSSLRLETSDTTKTVVALELRNTFTTTGKLWQLRSINDGRLDIANRTDGNVNLTCFPSGRVAIGQTAVQIANANVSLNGMVATNGAIQVQGTITGTSATGNGIEIDWFNNEAYFTSYGRTSGLWYPIIIRGSQIDFFTAGSNRARFTSAGRLLLGTVSESTFLLDVNGTARVKATLSNDSGQFVITDSASANPLFRFTGSGKLFIGNASFPSVIQNFGALNNLLASYNYLDGATDNTGTFGAFNIGSIGNIAAFSVSGRFYNNLYLKSNITTSFNTAEVNEAVIGTIINGTSTGVMRGLYINPTLTSGGSGWLAIQSSIGGAYFNTTSVSASAILQADSTTKGFLPPRMTNGQILAIVTPAVGLVAYQTDGTEGLYQYKSTGWALVAGTGGGSGTVTSTSVVSANGFAGTVANASTTPAITLSTTVTGLLKGNGTAISAAVSGTDFQAPSASLTSLAGLTFASTSFVKMTAAGTFALDTNTYYLASNPSGYTANAGTVTSVGGTGTVSGLTLTGNVTTSGNLTLGGTLALTAANVNAVGAITNSTSGNAATANALTNMNISQFTNNSGYITGNQGISISGDGTGSGSTSIAFTLATVNSNIGTFNNVTVNGKGLVTAASNVSYLTANQSITLSGAVTGSGTTAITTTLANSVVGIANLSATGTPSATSYLRGDNTWATVTGGGSSLATKSGNVTNTSFAGNPLKYTVTFSTAFASANYAIVITGADARSWTFESRTASGFVINSNSSLALTGNTSWIAILNGES